MTQPNQDSQGQEKRRYIRIKGSFPVEFTIVRLQDDLLDLPWSKGHTCNVSQSGIGLETKILSESVIRYLSKRNLYLELKIHVPTKEVPMKAIVEVMWYKPIEDNDKCFLIGLDFRSVIEEDLNLLISQARAIQENV